MSPVANYEWPIHRRRQADTNYLLLHLVIVLRSSFSIVFYVGDVDVHVWITKERKLAISDGFRSTSSENT